jgi:hypothetical protein
VAGMGDSMPIPNPLREKATQARFSLGASSEQLPPALRYDVNRPARRLCRRAVLVVFGRDQASATWRAASKPKLRQRRGRRSFHAAVPGGSDGLSVDQ